MSQFNQGTTQQVIMVQQPPQIPQGIKLQPNQPIQIQPAPPNPRSPIQSNFPIHKVRSKTRTNFKMNMFLWRNKPLKQCSFLFLTVKALTSHKSGKLE